MPLLLCATCLPAYADGAEADSTDTTELEEIVITGTLVPKTLKNTPVQTRLISRRDIEHSDATDVQDLLQTELPGVEFSYAMNQQVHLNFNGQGGQSVLFLVDGERMAGETMDDVDFTRLNMANVDHIEIVKGAASALYGSNAGGGVINIITKKATRPFGLNASARLARHNEQRYRLSLTNSTGRWQNVLTGTHSRIDNYDVHSAPNPITRVVSTIYGNKVYNVNDRLSYSPADNLRLTARAGYFFRELARVEDSPERYRDFTGGMKAEWGITACDRLSLSYGFDQYDKSDFLKITNLDVRNYSNVQNSVHAIYNHYFADGNSMTFGADYLNDFMRNRKLAEPRHRQQSFDLYGQYDYTVNSRWELVGALRYDWFSDGGNARLTPKISASYRPASGLNVRFGYGMGFRAPTLKEKYYRFDMAGIWIVNGNPDLKPESSHNFNASADYTRGQFSYSLSLYYNRIHNRISTGVPYYRPDDATRLYLDYTNLRDYSVLGGEATVTMRLACGLSGRVSYAYTREHVPHDSDGNAVNNQYIPARRHSLTTRLDWDKDFSGKYSMRVSLNGRFLSGVSNVEYKDYYDVSQGTVTVDYPAYTMWKLSLVQTFCKKVSLTLAVDNLFNYKPKYYYLNCPLTDGANFMAGVSVDIP